MLQQEHGVIAVGRDVPGVDGEKMSKSYGNTLEIFGPEKALRKQVMGIVTDSTPVEAPKDPAESTFVQIYRLFASAEEGAMMEEQFRRGGVGYGEFKKRLFDAFWETFRPMRERRARLQADPGYVERILAQGAAHAREVASETMRRVRAAVGLA